MEKYISVLLEKYPKAITQAELAEASSVTKSAISKIRDKLVTLCDIKTLAFYKKLVLASDTKMVGKLFFFYVFHRLSPNVFLKSHYLHSLLQKWKIHERLSTDLAKLHYATFFDEKDTNLFITIILYNLTKAPLPSVLFQEDIHKVGMDQKGLMIRMMAYFPIIEDLRSNYDVPEIGTEEDMMALLELRDKVYHFILYHSKQLLPDWEVLENIDNDENKAKYVEAYLQVIDFYVQKYAKTFTSLVEAKAKKNKLPFEKQFYETGKLFKPNIQADSDIYHNQAS